MNSLAFQLAQVNDENGLVGIDRRRHGDFGLPAQAVDELGQGRPVQAQLVRRPPDRSRTEKVDKILIHPVAGLGLFLLIMFVLFQALFAWSKQFTRLSSLATIM